MEAGLPLFEAALAAVTAANALAGVRAAGNTTVAAITCVGGGCRSNQARWHRRNRKRDIPEPIARKPGKHEIIAGREGVAADGSGRPLVKIGASGSLDLAAVGHQGGDDNAHELPVDARVYAQPDHAALVGRYHADEIAYWHTKCSAAGKVDSNLERRPHGRRFGEGDRCGQCDYRANQITNLREHFILQTSC